MCKDFRFITRKEGITQKHQDLLSYTPLTSTGSVPLTHIGSYITHIKHTFLTEQREYELIKEDHTHHGTHAQLPDQTHCHMTAEDEDRDIQRKDNDRQRTPLQSLIGSKA